MADCPHGYHNGVGCTDCQDREIMQKHLDAVSRELEDANEEAARLRSLNAELVEALRALTQWSKCFVEDTPISAETLWRRFPQAIKEADDALSRARAKEDT